MTLDNVFQWSQEAGVASGSEPVNITALQRFAALVAAAEREACAKVCEKAVEYNPDDADVAFAFADAIRARKETC